MTQLKGHSQPSVTLKIAQPEPALADAGARNEPVPKLELNQPASEVSKGEGIGLRIVNQFSQLLGGKLEVETAPAQGTSFRLRLPIRYAI